jgi:hypothetical protein
MSKRYMVENKFEHLGYKCVVVFHCAGHRCGYVGVPKEHPLYKKSYGDYIEIKKMDVPDKKVSGIFPLFGAVFDEDERFRIEAYFECHGGITYSDGGDNSAYPIESDLWWFGFDCAHCDDGNDLKLAYERFPDYRDVLTRRMEVEEKYSYENVIRTQEYVEEECKSLAEQLKQFELKVEE